MQEKALAAPTGILCNLRAEPLGVSISNLRFSWQMNDNALGARQTAYQMQIASTREKARAQEGDVYDSGKVISGQSVNVFYAGPSLEPERAYYVRLRLWNEADCVSEWSEPLKLITQADNAPFRAIWHKEDARFVFFRKSISKAMLSDALSEAFVYVTAEETADIRQYACKLYVEGTLVGVAPTRSAEKLPYHTFDILPYIKKNKTNVIGSIGFSAAQNRSFAFRLVLCYEDGTQRIIDADESVRTMAADATFGMEARFTGYYAMGNENICTALYPNGFSEADFAEIGWTAARIVREIPASALTAYTADDMKLLPVTPIVQTQKDGVLSFDMGKEVVGILRLRFSSVSKEGKLTIRLAEQQNPDGTPRYRAATGVTYEEEWCLAAGFAGVVENFGYRAFRYGELLNLPPGASVQIEVIKLACPFAAHMSAFRTTEELLESIWDVCKYTIETATMDLYQDCPTRERGPYEGDAYIHQLSHYAVDRKYDVARYSLEYLYTHPTWCEEYKPLIVLSAWEDYMATGDATSLAAHYKTLCQKTRVPDETGLVPVPEKGDRPILIDWPPSLRDGHTPFPDGIAHSTVASAFHAAAWLTLAKIAAVLGKTEDQKTFSAYGETIKAALCRMILPSGALAESLHNREKETPSAHASFYPVAFGLLEKEAAEKAMQYVLSRPAMPCNVYGAQFLLSALFEQGLGEEAIARLTSKETNSWYHMIFELEATTVPEAWDFSLKPNMTMCHAWGSAPLHLTARYIAGVSPLKPGYEKLLVMPRPSGLKKFHVCVPTIRGAVCVDWFQIPDGAQLTVIVPANTTAKIGVPLGTKNTTQVTVNGTVQTGTREGEHLFFEVEAGMHFIII